ncbi:MAG: Gfo/Idh/MocA family oxidoreductase [Bacillota bacterium]|jgi:UDP-N-acetylglucosamine 3-dehydrogenase
MKVGIISVAHMHAYSYARALKQLEGVELAGIADPDQERGGAAARRFGVQFFPDIDGLLDSDIDAVIVTSENVKHREHVLAAARAGKHVLCEKPLATILQDAREMIEACKKNGVELMTAFPVRFNPSIARAREMIKEGRLGRILAIKGTNRGKNPGGWFVDPSLSGGGAVMDHTVHVVDVMRWFMGSEVREVYAEVDRLPSAGGIDEAGILTMEFDNGVFATLDCSWSRNRAFPTWGDVTLEIVGTEGALSVDAFAQKLHVYTDDQGVSWDYWGDDMDVGMIREFVVSIREGRSPSVTGEDGLKAVEVALAAYRAAETQTPVILR